MNSVPKEVVKPNLRSLIPVLLNALAFDDSARLVTSLNGIEEMVLGGNENLVEYLSSLIPHLIALSALKYPIVLIILERR